MKNSFINSKEIEICGTSFIDEINVPYKKLVETFGKETHGMSGDYKCQCEWSLKFSDGTVATIYDWKSNKKYCGKSGISKTKNTNWHIGGFNETASLLVKTELGLL
jgi:hypothetical protein